MAELLLVSLGSTVGLRASDDELAASLRRCGADVAVVAAATPRQVRTLALTDLAWARAARVAAFAGIAREQPRAIIYSTITAALLAPAPGAIRLDALSAQNRPGRHGIWQRPRERAVLARSPLLLPVSEEALTGAPERHAPRDRRTDRRRAVGAAAAAPAARHRRDHLCRQPGQEGPRPRSRGLGGGAPRGRGTPS